jgi:predicted secreted hydrolase
MKRTYSLVAVGILAFGGVACGDAASVSADASTDIWLSDPSSVDGHIVPADGDVKKDIAAEDAKIINLPADEAPHQTPMEWWYYTGVLNGQNGEIYGFEYVIFQAFAFGVTGYMTHYAITDLQKGTFALDSDQHVGALPASTQPGFDLKIGNWTMSGHAGKDKLYADMPGYAIDLSLSATKPVVFQYGTGAMTVGSANPFYYYSYTRMDVSGTITVDDEAKTVTGEAWMDHQWGDVGTDYAGWDWYSLRLDDNTEVMLFVVRKDGKDGFVGGTFIDEKGASMELKAEDFTITSTGTWKSPRTEATYPLGWTISIPSLALEATVDPLVQDQEFYHSILGSPIYWEGLCSITASRNGSPVGGDAYVELTSYTP